MRAFPRKVILPQLNYNHNNKEKPDQIQNSSILLTQQISNLNNHIINLVEQQKRTNSQQHETIMLLIKQLQLSQITNSTDKDNVNLNTNLNRKQFNAQNIFDHKICQENQGKREKYYDNRIEARMRNVEYPVPNIISSVQNQRVNQIINWVGLMLKQIFSVGFNLFKNNDLQQNKYKAYCSQNILRNLIFFSKKHSITPQQIFLIDKALAQQWMPYFKLKYPQTQQMQPNRQFQSMLVQRDFINDNQYDLVYRSQVKFQYQEDGNYNGKIMQFINFVISLPDKLVFSEKIFNYQNNKQDNIKKGNNNLKSKTVLKKSFYSDIQTFFKMIQEEQLVPLMRKFDPKTPQLYNPNFINQNLLKQSDAPQRQKYRQKVQSYTSFQIGQKLSDNNKPYTEYEINSGNLNIRSSAMMRVLTKWCQELEQCFNQKTILNRETPFRMENGEQKFIQKRRVQYLNYLLQRQKQQINKKLKEINQNNYRHQAQQLKAKTHPDLLKFSEDEGMIGQFSSFALMNNESYIISYINLLMHGIKKACQNFSKYMCFVYQYFKDEGDNEIRNFQRLRLQDIFNEVESNFFANPKIQMNVSSQTPQLITFRIGDLLRCKCSSKQKQIIALYKQIQRVSQFQPKHLRIIRVKNRLNSGNKDILMNILYKNEMIIEVQLAIKQQKSRFIQCSNKFNHYFYELKRAKFGAIIEMCNIWMGQDSRADFYRDKQFVIVKTKNKQNKGSYQQSLKHCCRRPALEFYTLPFICDNCQWHYSESNLNNHHVHCTNCNKLICFCCQFQKLTIQQKIKLIPEINQIQKINLQKLKFVNEIPQKVGIIINLNSKIKKPIVFYTALKDGQFYLFQYNKQKSEAKLIHQFKHKSIPVSFLKQNIICTSNKIVLMHNKQYAEMQKLIKKYFVSNFLLTKRKSEKTSISIIGEDLTQQLIQVKQIKGWPHVKTLNLSQNTQIDLNRLVNIFPNVEIAIINNINSLKISEQMWTKITRLHLKKNKIMNIDFLINCTQLIELDISYNFIQKVPDLIKNLKRLKKLLLNNNKLSAISSEIKCLDKLIVLDFNNNEKLQKLPDAFESLQCLQIFSIKKTGLIYLPQSLFINKPKLTNLQIKMNQKLTKLPQSLSSLPLVSIVIEDNESLTYLPQSFGDMKTLKQIKISNNRQLINFSASFGNLSSLEQLIIEKNKKLQVLPESLGNLSSLNTLSINWNTSLTQLPASLGNLTSLRDLRIEFNMKLLNLPQSIGCLSQLKTFTLFHNQQISTLPDSIGKLKSLELLNIYWNNNISQFPSTLGDLTSLKSLTISRCYVKTLPGQLGKLKSLQTLMIDQNQIMQALPQSLGNLISLKKLTIENNSLLKYLPTTLGNLVNLQQVKIKNNASLSSLSENLNNMKKLKALIIDQNISLKFLPESVAPLISLQKLIITQNSELLSLPQSFGKCPSLIQIKIFKNKSLKSIFSDYSGLSSLKLLNIDSNDCLEQLPKSFGNLSSLRQVIINNCPLLKTFPQVGQLSSLEQLSITNNKNLNRVPESISKLSNLRKLKICDSPIQQISASISELLSLNQLQISRLQKIKMIPQSIGKLVNLKHLRIDSLQQLQYLPQTLGNLLSLKQLIIYGNSKLISLPDSLGNLIQLQQLNVNCNKLLTTLPQSLSKLNKLRQLALCGNDKIVNLPQWIIQLPQLTSLMIDQRHYSQKLRRQMPNCFFEIMKPSQFDDY